LRQPSNNGCALLLERSVVDILDLRYFVAVTQTMNITKAAEELFITRQALSKAIREFEKECGSELFLRSSGKLQMTPLGRDILEKAVPILDLFNDLDQSVSSNSLHNKNKIRIAIGLGTLNTLSPRVFENFRLDYPKIELDIKEVFGDDVRKAVESEEADIGLINSTPEKLGDYDSKLVQEGNIWFQISRDNPLSAKDQITAGDLHHQPFVTLGDRFDIHNMLMEKCHQAHSSPNIILETIDSNVANNMVYNNLAISFAIHSKNPAENPLISVIPMDLGDTPWGTYVISRKGFKYSVSTRLLIDYLVNFTD
jgi:DNA-binding transcriptional LysR family regulator